VEKVKHGESNNLTICPPRVHEEELVEEEHAPQEACDPYLEKDSEFMDSWGTIMHGQVNEQVSFPVSNVFVVPQGPRSQVVSPPEFSPSPVLSVFPRVFSPSVFPRVVTSNLLVDVTPPFSEEDSSSSEDEIHLEDDRRLSLFPSRDKHWIPEGYHGEQCKRLQTALAGRGFDICHGFFGEIMGTRDSLHDANRYVETRSLEEMARYDRMYQYLLPIYRSMEF
jgi:hypothetical protein